MSKAIDPFEEFLRKKKVKMLEEKFRRERAAEEEAAEADDEGDTRLQEEMDDFFESGQTAGAELFSKAKDLSDEKVDEIKDALEDVFEKEVATPRTEEVPADEPFVHFFKKVQTDFDDEPPAPPAIQEPPPPAVETPVSPVAKKPAAKKPVAKKRAAKPAPKEREPAPAPVEAPGRESIAVEISSHEPLDEPGPERAGRLNLVDMLLAGNDESDELGRRIEVLCRLVAKLAERIELPESEIVEALIKSGVEF
jgi:hypothetical protein